MESTRRVRASLLVLCGLVAACVYAVATAPSASACSCPVISLEKARAGSATAFAGTVSETRDAGDGLQVTRVDVETAYRGTVRTVMEVSHGTFDSSCGIEVGDGDRLMAFTYSYQGSGLHLDGCVTLVDREGDEGKAVDAAMRRLGPGTDPLPGARTLDLGEPAGDPAAGLKGWWPVGAAALVVLGLLLWVRRWHDTRAAT